MNSNEHIYTPYLYLIGWSKLEKYYIGIRYTKSKKNKCLYETGCHPDDLWKTYFTSSKVVSRYRKEYGEPDVIQVRKTFKTPEETIRYEKKIFNKIDIIGNDKWLNLSKMGELNHLEEMYKNISKTHLGKRKTKSHCLNISKSRKGMKFSESHKENIRKATTGVKPSKENLEKRSKSMSKLKWWNDGKQNCRSEFKPSDNWVSGRLPFKK